jgi:hypothetical protein
MNKGELISELNRYHRTYNEIRKKMWNLASDLAEKNGFELIRKTDGGIRIFADEERLCFVVKKKGADLRSSGVLFIDKNGIKFESMKDDYDRLEEWFLEQKEIEDSIYG